MAMSIRKTAVYKRINNLRENLGMTWEELAKAADIRMGTWMTGIPTQKPTDEELEKMAPVLGTTFEYLKYGII